MTAQEQQLIDELVERIRSTNVQGKDSEAEEHLRQGLVNSPDALYILAQTVIVQKYGLEQAQQRLGAMQSELDSLRDAAAESQSAPKPVGGSFLSHIFGGSSAQSQQPVQTPSGNWQPVSAPAYGQPGYPQPGYPQPGYPPAPAGYPPPGYGYGQPSGWGASPMGMGGGGGGFLQGALQTAAGVAMGEMAIQSIESLFHGFGGGGGYGGYGRGFEGGQPSETIINNYEDGGEHRHEESRDRDGDSSFYNPHNDASRDSDTHAFAGKDADVDDRNDRDEGKDDSDDSGNNDAGDDSSFDSGDDGVSSGDDNY